MSRTFHSPGNTIDAIAGSGGVTVGVGLMLGALFGVPEVTAAEGDTYALTVVGVHTLPKASGELQAGAIAYWDDSAHAVGASAAGKFAIGVVVAHAGSSDQACLVRLNGTAAPAVPGP